MKHTKSEEKVQEKAQKPQGTAQASDQENKKEAVTQQKAAEQAPAEPEIQETTAEETAAAENEPECSEAETAKKALDELQSKYDKLNDTYLRTLAEYDNFRKRTIKEKADLIKTGGESVLINILTIVDDMERGINASAESEDVVAVKEGMQLIHSKFNTFLKQNGLKEIETDGQAFNTDLHEAIASIPAPDESLKGKIIDCVQKGYYLHDKVIRFAKVVVGE